jgi:hypothetical protein
MPAAEEGEPPAQPELELEPEPEEPQMAAPEEPTKMAWGECPCVFVGNLAEVAEGPTSRSMPPIYNHTLTFTVTEVLRGELPEGVSLGATLTCANSACQADVPISPAAGTACIVGAVAAAMRGRMMMMPGPQVAMNCLRLDERSDESHAAAVLGCSLPFGWGTGIDGAVVSPWASLGADSWSPGEGSTIAGTDGAHVCSVTNPC